jgi:hypothetical protein
MHMPAILMLDDLVATKAADTLAPLRNEPRADPIGHA